MPADRPHQAIDLSTPRRIHVVNVGGAGMSAIATVLAQMGHAISGVDDKDTPFLAPLRDLGVDVTVGPSGLAADAAVDAVVTSTATPQDHPDVVAAGEASVPVLHRSDALASICAERDVLAVAGTHGKSTTTGMVATILDGVGDGAGYLAGTRITGLGRNADWRTGPGFVVEADESDGTFLRVGATDALVTNVEADHLSYWGTEDALVEGFRSLVGGLDGTAVLCLDDPGAAALAPVAGRSLTYGTDPAADLRITDIGPAGIGVRFTLHHGDEAVEVEVPTAPGSHNARNAAGALGACLVRGVPLADGARALRAFAGVARRFEQRGVAGGVTFVDSYDHLPTEVAAALAAARTGPFDRVVCVFQPHRYTRTRDLAHTFADAFADADVLGVTELYSAGEAPIEGVSGALVRDAVVAAHPDADVAFLPDLGATEAWLLDVLRPGDLCLTLNAGDLTDVPDRVLAALQGSAS
ncbi:UDP-N-acetylmuramate--L-alanine ligase [Acidimicrobiia bacterium EGI L10123]|uniref:UDP-N-acetylmuramate--L-alanine ligase n=1 Tax=Salinilacustrithrix flava TaxID=2957203 RepID=UPI003D7C326B|nr:UDP-N-acetylmuramate--L-alanine ligase [Acidimicrobiia bacterium EGI L10123]